MKLDKFKIILNKYLALVIGVILFFIPFFWFSNNQIILGGESFLIPDPGITIKKISYSWGDYILGLPNISITTELYQIFNYALSRFVSISIVQKIIFGLFLAGPFFSFYILIKKIFAKSDDKLAVVASLFYVFNPFYVITFGWIPTYGFLFTFFPLLFLQVIKIFEAGNKKAVFYLAVISFLGSVTGLNIAVFGLIFLVILLYYLTLLFLQKNKFYALSKKVLLIFFIVILTNIFWIWPIYNYRQDLFSSAIINKAIFSANSLFSSPILNGLTLNQYYWFNKTDAVGNLHYSYSSWYQLPSKFIILAFIISIIYTLTIRKRRISNNKSRVFFLFSLLLFLVGVFLSKGTASPFGEFYKILLENIKIFGIYRASDIKFPFLVVIGISFFIFYFLKSKSNLIKVTFFILICFLGSPFIFGKIFKDEMKIIIPKYWREYNTYINSNKLSNRVILFPKNNSPFDNYVWGYEGAWLTSQLNKKNSIGSSQGYGSSKQEAYLRLSEYIYTSFEENDIKSMLSFLTKFSVKQIIQRDDFDIKNSAQRSESMYLYKKDTIEDFFNKNEQYFYSQGSFDKLHLYSLKNEYYLPHFYTPMTCIFSNRESTSLPEILSDENLEIRSAVFFEHQNKHTGDKLKIALGEKKYSEKLAVLEFKKINPVKYRVRIHSANGIFPLVFSESFHDAWKAYIAGVESKKLASHKGNEAEEDLNNYKILDGNIDDQATKEELMEYIKKGWVTDLGDGKEKEIEHSKWENNKEKLDYVEEYHIDFVSKNFQDTIQNDNLPNGNIFETWFQKPIENNENHLMVNGYANAWIIDPSEVCKVESSKVESGESPCIQNPDGSYDMEIIVEFWPQRLFYLGAGISGLTLLGCLIYLGYDWRRRRKISAVSKENSHVEKS